MIALKDQVFDVHVGDSDAFDGYKLLWTDEYGCPHKLSISEVVATILVANGMDIEG